MTWTGRLGVREEGEASVTWWERDGKNGRLLPFTYDCTITNGWLYRHRFTATPRYLKGLFVT